MKLYSCAVVVQRASSKSNRIERKLVVEMAKQATNSRRSVHDTISTNIIFGLYFVGCYSKNENGNSIEGRKKKQSK